MSSSDPGIPYGADWLRLISDWQKNSYKTGSIVPFILFHYNILHFYFPEKHNIPKSQRHPESKIYSVINSINPLNWIKIGNHLKKEKPDIIVVRFWLPFMGPALGTILKKVKRNKHTKIICISRQCDSP